MITTGGNRLLAWVRTPQVFDTLLATALSVAILIEANSGDAGLYHNGVLLMSVPLYWRRRYPLTVFGVVLLGAIAAATNAEYTGFFCIIVAAYSVGEYSRYRAIALIVFLATAIGVDAHYGGALPQLPNSAGPFIILFPFWLIGMGMRTRQLRADALEDRAERLEREREQATQLARAEERARIARELHDVVAHSVSVMLVQAGAARQVLTSSPEEARGALLAVENSGREAMAELRTLLGLLKEEGAGVDLAPQPGVDQLDTLVARVRDAGLPVELHLEGTPAPLPIGLDLTAYRIVQEALTNALKYSGRAPTQVALTYREDELKIEVLDDGPSEPLYESNGVSSQRGLVGMGERVALYGGRLETGPRPGGGYAVRAWLPLAVPEQA